MGVVESGKLFLWEKFSVGQDFFHDTKHDKNHAISTFLGICRDYSRKLLGCKGNGLEYVRVSKMILGQRNNVNTNDEVSTFFGHCVWYVCAGEERERGEKAREKEHEREISQAFRVTPQ